MHRVLLSLLCFAAFVVPTSSWEATVTGNLSIAVTAATQSSGGTCPQGTAVQDGCSAAPTGTPQYPTLLDSYVASPHKASPKWNVAGVDYRVGINTGTTLSPVSSLSALPGITINTSNMYVECSGAASVTIDGIDFAGYFFYNSNCGNVTIINSKFSCTVEQASSSHFAFIQDTGSHAWTIKYNELYGDNCGTWPNNLSDPISITNAVVQYNLFRHMPERHLSSWSGAIDYRFNLIDQPNTQNGAHENYLQWSGGGTVSSLLVAFNTSYNALSVAGAEGYQFYNNSTPATFVSPTFTNNVLIAKPNGGAATMSNMVHGSCHTSGGGCSVNSGSALNADNYFDPSGAFGAPYYPGAMTAAYGWSSTGNINMVNGAVITPQ